MYRQMDGNIFVILDNLHLFFKSDESNLSKSKRSDSHHGHRSTWLVCRRRWNNCPPKNAVVPTAPPAATTAASSPGLGLNGLLFNLLLGLQLLVWKEKIVLELRIFILYIINMLRLTMFIMINYNNCDLAFCADKNITEMLETLFDQLLMVSLILFSKRKVLRRYFVMLSIVLSEK